MKDDQASSTAYTVLQGLLLTAKRPALAHLVGPDTIAAGTLILRASSEGQRRLRQLDSPLYRALLLGMERLLLPGIATHYALRKKYIREAVERALSDGVLNVVNLGAGFDTLAYELHRKHGRAQFFELDHPATSAHKGNALRLGVGDNLHLIPVDFSKTKAEEVLAAHPAFDATKPTIFICEGVLMYLDPDDVAGLFAGLRWLCGHGCRFVFSCVSPMAGPDNNCGPLLRLYLTIKGEPLSWYLTPDALPSFIAEQHYELLDHAGTDELAQRYLSSDQHGTLHRGEFLALAMVAGEVAAAGDPLMAEAGE